METQLIATILTGVFTLAGIIITVTVQNKKTRIETELRLEQQQEQIDAINKKLEQHNNYAVKIPVIERDIQYIRENISDIKKKIGA